MHRSDSAIGSQLLVFGNRPFNEGRVETLREVISVDLKHEVAKLCPKTIVVDKKVVNQPHEFDSIQFKGHEMQISYRRVDA